MIESKYRNAIEQYTRTFPAFPEPPGLISRLQDIMYDPEVSLDIVELIISEYPILSSSLLEVVNSPFYGFEENIPALRGAIRLLGLNGIINLIYILSVMQPLMQQKLVKDTDKYNEVWVHLALTGRIAGKIAEQCRVPGGIFAFLAGILHDVGQLVFMRNSNGEYEQLSNLDEDLKTRLWQREIQAYGFHHGHLGGWMAEKWGLPEPLQYAITYHTSPEKAKKYQELVNVVALVDMMLKAWYNSDMVFQFEAIKEREDVQQLLEATPVLNSFDCYDLQDNIQLEFEDSQRFVELCQTCFH